MLPIRISGQAFLYFVNAISTDYMANGTFNDMQIFLSWRFCFDMISFYIITSQNKNSVKKIKRFSWNCYVNSGYSIYELSKHGTFIGLQNWFAFNNVSYALTEEQTEQNEELSQSLKLYTISLRVKLKRLTTFLHATCTEFLEILNLYSEYVLKERNEYS